MADSQRPPSPPTPPPGQMVEYEVVHQQQRIKVTETRDGRTGALISRTEAPDGGPVEVSRIKVRKGQRPAAIGTRGCGPSGKPLLHFKLFPNRKSAEDAARQAGRGNPPVHHTAHEPGQRAHFHPADRTGQIIKDGAHFEYPN